MLRQQRQAAGRWHALQQLQGQLCQGGLICFWKGEAYITFGFALHPSGCSCLCSLFCVTFGMGGPCPCTVHSSVSFALFLLVRPHTPNSSHARCRAA